MKFYSEKLNKLFETEKECAEAEDAHEKALVEAEAKKKALAEERASRAKEVEDAYKAVLEAKKIYNKKLDAFLKDYKQFHMTFTSMAPFEPWFESWF